MGRKCQTVEIDFEIIENFNASCVPEGRAEQVGKFAAYSGIEEPCAEGIVGSSGYQSSSADANVVECLQQIRFGVAIAETTENADTLK